MTYGFANNRTGIGLYNDADYNKVIGNFCYNNTNPNSGQYGMGIWIAPDGDYNLIAGNNCLYNDINIEDRGTNNDLVGNNGP